MNKAILIIDMPDCCANCFALDDHYDYPECLITKEQRGYNFNTKERKMDKCPLIPIPEKLEEDGDNNCLDNIILLGGNL